MEEFTPTPEAKEGEPQPSLIIDFIRHGHTAYGPALKEKVTDIGQNPDTFNLMPDVDETIEEPREQLEGRITEKGEAGLREAARTLAEQIDKETEIVAIIHGPRTRHEQSTAIIADELQKSGIDVTKTRKHNKLVDVEGGGWYTFVDYVVNQQGKPDADLEALWWEMYQNEETREDMKAKGYESLSDVANRTEYVAELLKRFVRRYNLGKTLRVIAVTSDINIEQIMQKGIPAAERDQIWIQNAEIYEVREYKDVTD